MIAYLGKTFSQMQFKGRSELCELGANVTYILRLKFAVLNSELNGYSIITTGVKGIYSSNCGSVLYAQSVSP